MTIKTLLIEDDPALANLSKLRLQRLDMEVFHASDGMQAMDYLDENQPNLILLDINIPMIDGWGVLEAAKNRYGQSFKVIVTSARRDIISRAKGEIEGVDRYLVKPFTSEELIETIQSVMEEADE
jgi:DNA-binding response OmpR family regulator